MATPTPGDVHVNAPLTNISVAYVQSGNSFVADKVFPTVGVERQSDLFYKFNKGDFLRDEAKVRGPASESAGGGFRVTTDSYSAVPTAFHKDVDDQLRANADSVLSLDRAATEYVTQKLLISRERTWASSFFTTGVWGTDSTPSTLWSAANSTPLKDVEAGKMSILQNTGFMPNTMVMGAQVFSALRDNATIRDQFKYTSADSIDLAMLARFFNIERVLVMQGVYTSSAEGQSDTQAFIGGKNSLLCYSAPSPSLMTPTAGYTFAWSGYTGSIGGMRIKKWREERLAADRIEGEMAYAQKVVASEMGYFFSSCVA
jgi:hypothetical protein